MRRRRLLAAKPLAQLGIVINALLLAARLVGLAAGAVLVLVLLLSPYDRTLVLSGRTERLSMRLDSADFGGLHFDASLFRPDPDTQARQGRLQLDLLPGATIHFLRIGRGAGRLTFQVDAAGATEEGCPAGLHRIGTATSDQAASVLCDAAVVTLPLAAGADPLVIGLSGDLAVGEEVSQGAGPRPILLEATASLVVKHGGPVFHAACRSAMFEHLCDRFVADTVVLSPGSSVRAAGQADTARAGQERQGRKATGLGFIRIDPNEVQSGMMFNLAAVAEAFEVTRMESKAFTVRESLFDVIEKSPAVRTLGTIASAMGMLWYFRRLLQSRDGEAGRGAGMILAGVLLGAPAAATAQQALLRADEIGQGLLRARGDRCYAVTPGHVMGAETSALVTAPGREQGEGDLLRRIPAAPEPMALLTLRGVPPAACPAFEGAAALDGLLRGRTAATLQLVRADGSIDRIPLLLASVETETLEVRSETGALEQGMSGGTVLVADQPAGLLVDVTDEGRTGRVARLDRIFERVAPHLSNALPAAAVSAPDEGIAYEVVRSNASPVKPENKVASLRGEGPGPWRVSATGRVELVLRVSAPVGGVALDLRGLDDPPGTVEVLGGRSERGPWQSLASLALEPGDTVQVRHFPPVNLPFLLLRAYRPPNGLTLAINRASFISK